MRVHTFTVFTIVLAITQLMMPADAEGQRLSTDLPFTTVNFEVTVPDTLGSLRDSQLSSSPITLTPTRSLYSVSIDTTTKGLKRRVLPYYVAGLIAGGALGFAVMPRSCDVGDNMFCQVFLAAYPIAGAATGGLIGLLVGYHRERR